MYFVFSVIALLCWSCSDLFSKKGTLQKDKNSHWRVIFTVGIIMGLHALFTIIISSVFNFDVENDKWWYNLFYTDFKFHDFITYLPVAFIYLSAMVIGYAGLRYIELSISSPICNSSGSLALVICIVLGWAKLDIPSLIGVILITFGIIFLGIIDYKENDELKKLRQEKSEFKYNKSFIAILIPVIYLVLDALGTVGDQAIYKLNLSDMSDYASNTAYELTSFCFSAFAFIYIKLIKKERLFVNYEKQNKNALFLGATCETIGQCFYMSVMFSDFSVGMPIISSYCVFSVLLSRIFINERLSVKHYISITLTIIGIILLGVFSPV